MFAYILWSYINVKVTIFVNIGQYMNTHVLLKLLNKFGKREEMPGSVEHFITFSRQV